MSDRLPAPLRSAQLTRSDPDRQLAIAKWAVEMHDGTINVFQRLGGGAEFRILLPLVTSVSAAHKQQVDAGGMS